jgi:PA14 domain-containing protein/dolichyl-phosphate-mannose-protein mannosyltransferase
LIATCFSDTGWTSRHHEITGAPLSTDGIVRAWRGSPPAAFSVSWSGAIVVFREADYTFTAAADAGAWVYVDGVLVVDDGGRHAARAARGDVHLDRGVHALLIRYVRDGGPLHLELTWSRDGGVSEPMPAWALVSRHTRFARAIATIVVRRAEPWLAGLWAVVLLAAVAGPLRRRLTWPSWLSSERAAFGAVVVGAVVLDTVAIGWGVPSTWAGDEITPKAVFIGLSRHFSNGWFDRYPPLHFYVLGAVFSPWLLIKSLHWAAVSDAAEQGILLVAGRAVSVAASIGTLFAVRACTADAFGRRAGVLAAAAMALMTPFVYYSKVANPEAAYIFWFALSLVFYLRLLRAIRRPDLMIFALTATAAICTKDQAYALYLIVPFVVVFLAWQANRDRRLPRPFVQALIDPRLAIAATGAVALFMIIHNVPLNAAGFVKHVRDVVGPGSSGYQMVAPTMGGRLSLLRLTAAIDRRSWGWPLSIASAIGAVVALRESGSRRAAVGLLLVVATYYLGFIDVILYNYDRYLLPIGVVQAIFAGLALDRLLRWSGDRFRAVGIAIVAAALGYSALYAATVDVLMVRDSRYAAEQWLHAHDGTDPLVATVFPEVVLPRLFGVRSIDIGTVENLNRWRPDYFVLNADYARAVPRETAVGQLVDGMQRQGLGYRLVFRYRAAEPWPWLPAPHPDLVGPRRELPIVSFLRDINPTIEIYERTPG